MRLDETHRPLSCHWYKYNKTNKNINKCTHANPPASIIASRAIYRGVVGRCDGMECRATVMFDLLLWCCWGRWTQTWDTFWSNCVAKNTYASAAAWLCGWVRLEPLHLRWSTRVWLMVDGILLGDKVGQGWAVSSSFFSLFSPFLASFSSFFQGPTL